MNIVRAKDVEEFLRDCVLRNWDNAPREGVHLSDLLALRQAYWRRIHPLPATMDEILYWAAGKGHEGALSRAAEMEHGEAREWEGILYTPDFYHNFPAELKTRRRSLATPGTEAEKYEHYIKQLRGYCAVENRPMGWLHIMSLLERMEDGSTKPVLACYRVEFTADELEKERFSLKARKNALLYALDTPDGWKALEQCPPWMCGRLSRTMVKKPWCNNCQKEFATEYGGNQHPKSKTGAGHIVTPGVFNTAFEKRCKWFDICGPDLSAQPVEEEAPSEKST